MHPVVCPGFKPGKGRQPLLGRFDSCCFPPIRSRHMQSESSLIDSCYRTFLKK